MPDLTPTQWLLAALAAWCVGLSKSGFPGVSLATVVILARLFPGRASTGVLLPLLLCADVGAVLLFRQHAHWSRIRQLLPPTLAGVGLGFCALRYLSDQQFGPWLGAIILAMTVLQASRRLVPALFRSFPHSPWFAGAMGLLAGAVTMVGNGAGPLMALYFLAVDLPRLALVGTSAWFFLLVNLSKVPFSLALGLILPRTLLFNLALVPVVLLGLLSGRSLVTRVSPGLFEAILLGFTALASLRLLGWL